MRRTGFFVIFWSQWRILSRFSNIFQKFLSKTVATLNPHDSLSSRVTRSFKAGNVFFACSKTSVNRGCREESRKMSKDNGESNLEKIQDFKITMETAKLREIAQSASWWKIRNVGRKTDLSVRMLDKDRNSLFLCKTVANFPKNCAFDKLLIQNLIQNSFVLRSHVQCCFYFTYILHCQSKAYLPAWWRQHRNNIFCLFLCPLLTFALFILTPHSLFGITTCRFKFFRRYLVFPCFHSPSFRFSRLFPQKSVFRCFQ